MSFSYSESKRVRRRLLAQVQDRLASHILLDSLIHLFIHSSKSLMSLCSHTLYSHQWRMKGARESRVASQENTPKPHPKRPGSVLSAEQKGEMLLKHHPFEFSPLAIFYKMEFKNLLPFYEYFPKMLILRNRRLFPVQIQDPSHLC